MPKVKPRTPSRGEVHELKRLQAFARLKAAGRPPGSWRAPEYRRPKRLDGAS